MTLPLVGCVNNKENNKDDIKNVSTEVNGYKKLNKTYYDYFDTVTTILSYQKDEKDFEKHTKTLEEELDKYNKLYNSYDSFDGVNNIKTINDKAGKEKVKVDKEIIDLLLYSKQMYKKTNGKINIAMGSVLSLWHDARELATNKPNEAKLPEEEDLKQASLHKDIEKIEIDEKENTVYISDPNIKLDIGAIGKGYATQKIAEKLKEDGFSEGIISVGGDDVIIGDNPSSGDGNWKIAIQNPFLDQKDKPYSDVINIKQTSVVTSGDYQRTFSVDGKNYHHIIDPETLYPSNKWKSVSIITDDIALADTFSTYLFLLDKQEGEQIAKENNMEVFWIDHDGNEYKTSGWSDLEDK